jgi:hypothetical protein
MEPGGSLPCSQEHSDAPYPEPIHTTAFHLQSNLILSAHLRPGLPSVLFSSGFPINGLYALRFPPIRALCVAHHILIDIIILIIFS